MKPLRLVMSAFGSYLKQTEIDFEALGDGIFLITGDTGAGKTTIFDAIAFALYGETSGQRRDGSMMRSQSALPKQETRVELVFSDRGEVYRIVRSPSYERPSLRKKKNGEQAMTTQPARVSLFLPDGSEFPGKISDVNEKIREIVGVDRGQFSQTAMIAQGEYMRLLTAGSRERKEIFSRIFDTGVYERIQRKLRERNSELAKKLEDNGKFCLREAERIRVPEESGLAPRWEQAVSSLESCPEEILAVSKEACSFSRMEAEKERREDERLVDELHRLGSRIERARRVSELKEQEKAAEEHLRLLQSSQEVFEEKKRRLKLGRQAAPVWQKEDEARKKEGEWIEAGERLGEIKEKLSALSEDFLQAEKDSGEAESRYRAEQPGLLEQEQELKRSLPLYRELEQCMASIRAEEVRRERTKREEEASAEGQEDCLKRLAALKAEREEKRDSGLNLERCRAEIERLKKRKDEVTQLGRKLKELEEREKRLKEEQDILGRESRNYEQAAADYDRLYRIFILSQAGLLAEELREGKPCPVCGSLSHPCPARLLDERVTAEQLDRAKKVRETADRAARERLACVRALKAETGVVKSQCEAMYEAIRKPGADEVKEHAVFDRQNAFQEMRELFFELQEEQRQREREEKEWEKARIRLSEIDVLMEKEEKKREDLERKRKELSGELAGTESRLSSLKARYEEQKKQLLFETGEQAEERLSRIQEAAGKLLAEKEKAEKRKEELGRQTGLLKGRLASEEEKERKLLSQKEQIYGEWQELLQKMGFSGEEEYRSAILKEGEQERLEADISQYEQSLTAASSALLQCQKSLEGLEEEELSPLLEKEEAMKQERRLASFRLSESASRLAENEGACRELERLLGKRRRLLEEYGPVNRLCLAADGKVSGTARMDFQTYVQRQYFSQMIHAANIRLRRMTQGQFLLRCREFGDLSLRGEAGLDLDVYSVDTDSVRDVKTLSGGEAFLAALSMALGMADVIQNTAGSVEMDALFIDEGFGSLDDEARARAISVLKELSGGKRMIGIISHVAELREQMGRKIVVKKGEEGSFIRLETEE